MSKTSKLYRNLEVSCDATKNSSKKGYRKNSICDMRRYFTGKSCTKIRFHYNRKNSFLYIFL